MLHAIFILLNSLCILWLLDIYNWKPSGMVWGAIAFNIAAIFINSAILIGKLL